MDKKVISSIRNTTIVLNNHFLFKFYSFEDKFLFILSNHLQSLFSSMNSTENRRVIEYVETILHFRFSLSLLHFSHLEQDATRKRTLERILFISIYIFVYFFLSNWREWNVSQVLVQLALLLAVHGSLVVLVAGKSGESSASLSPRDNRAEPLRDRMSRDASGCLADSPRDNREDIVFLKLLLLALRREKNLN